MKIIIFAILLLCSGLVPGAFSVEEGKMMVSDDALEVGEKPVGKDAGSGEPYPQGDHTVNTRDFIDYQQELDEKKRDDARFHETAVEAVDDEDTGFEGQGKQTKD